MDGGSLRSAPSPGRHLRAELTSSPHRGETSPFLPVLCRNNPALSLTRVLLHSCWLQCMQVLSEFRTFLLSLKMGL